MKKSWPIAETALLPSRTLSLIHIYAAKTLALLAKQEDDAEVTRVEGPAPSIEEAVAAAGTISSVSSTHLGRSCGVNAGKAACLLVRNLGGTTDADRPSSLTQGLSLIHIYVETLLLVLFLLASLTVLVQILDAAKRTSREARELSTACLLYT